MISKLKGLEYLFVTVVATAALAALIGAAPASASPRLVCGSCSSWWHVETQSLPGNLPPGGEGKLLILAEDFGDAPPTGAPTVTDKLPAGLTAESVKFGATGVEGGAETLFGAAFCQVAAKEVTCAFPEEPEFISEVLPTAYSHVYVEIQVKVSKTAESGERNVVKISGGGTAASSNQPITVDSAPTPFGVENYEMRAENADGSPDTQAGSHPFQLTTTIALNQTADPTKPPEAVKDLHLDLPPGLIGNPTPFPQCTLIKFIGNAGEGQDFCPDDTVVGIASVNFTFPVGETPKTIEVPVFALVPSVGEPARFGFDIDNVLVYLDTSVLTGGSYAVKVDVNNLTELVGVFSTRVTFWGVPGDSRHDPVRGWNCINPIENPPPCARTVQATPPPLLTMPTACAGAVRTSLEADSWQKEGVFTDPSEYSFQDKFGRTITMDGCNQVPFTPSVKVTPDGQAGSTPTGLTVDEHVPQETSLNPTGLAESAVKGLSVTLPQGVVLNPAGADGLQACSVEQIGLQSREAPTCPEAAKVATATIRTPLLPNPLVGAAYLATQNANPFGSLVALYIYVYDPVSGVSAKAAGEVVENPVTGQLTAHFEGDPVFEKDPRYADLPEAQFLPELPFEDVELHFFGGDRAPLGTPSQCGSYKTTGTFTPWSETATTESSSEFQIVSGPNGSPCRNPLPFAPTLAAGTTSIQAGGFSPFTMTMSREDGNQNLQAVKLRMPPGMLGTLSTVKLCDEADANAGTCGPETEIGETTVSVGLGGDPYSVKGGKVYITGPYKGAPFGLSIVNPAKAGPFDLGEVVVRAKIEVDPITSVLTITTDNSGQYAIPHIIDGIPLNIQHINVTINRPNFTFNPTNCEPLKITGSLSSDEGSSAALSLPFQATNCAVLAFKPKLTASTSGKTSRKNGASLSVKLTYPAGPYDANIAKVKVDLPKQLPSVLTTLQKACLAATFEANPASCPPGSIVGSARATTPVLPVALTGPAYFVSYGGAKFPELVIVLSGYGVTVQLHGETFINPAGITSSTFKTIPDVPVGTFELTLPSGPGSALAANGDFCKSKLEMPTSFVGQNGAVINTTTPIAVTGCKPAIGVLHHGVKGSTVTIAASVPSAGKLVAGGPGLSRASKRIGKAGTVTLALKLSKAQALLLSRHPGRMLKIAVKLTFTPAHGQKLSGGVTVLIG
jgi:hypothetical protein